MRIRVSSGEFDSENVVEVVPVEIDRVVVITFEGVLDFRGDDALAVLDASEELGFLIVEDPREDKSV